jgi:uncharacterized membrane protein YheB (UPF0754 family)
MEEKSRTEQQNKSMHKWFKEVSDICLDNGVTVQHIINRAIHTQVDEDFIKWVYRRIGIKKKYIKKSTTELNTKQPSLIYDEMVKFFAHEVDPPIELPPFPSLEIKDYEKYIENTTRVKQF